MIRTGDAMVTIEQVARYAGVSVATVSRVLNGTTVKPAAMEKVQNAIRDLDYIPNQSARNLRRNESCVILTLAPNFSNPFYSHILTGIGDMAHDRGYSVLICNSAGSADNEQHFLKMLDGHRADGAIVLGCRTDCGWLADYARRFHIVQCCEYVPEVDCPSVSIDNYAAALETVRYLYGLGHRRIAMLGAANKYISTRLRRKGYRDAMAEAGLPVREEFYAEADADYSFTSGQAAAKTLLTREEHPTAIFCVSDILALSAISVAQEMGLSVPEQLTVTGFDDVDYTTMFHPYLTTVAQPCYEMGRMSVELLVTMLRGKDAPPVGRNFVPYRFVERESSAPPEKV